MFNIARIPHLYCDVISTAPHPTDPSAQKLFLMIHGWCYTITVYRPASPSSAHQEPQLQLIPAKEIEYSIRAIVFDAERRLQKGERAVNIGVLSADTRDKWAEVRSRSRSVKYELIYSCAESPTPPLPLPD